MGVSEVASLRRKRRWFQFSLRTLLLFVLLASLSMSWLAARMQRVKQQTKMMEAIEKAGGEVWYEHQFDASMQIIDVDGGSHPPGPAWLRRLVGNYFFATVVGLNSQSDFVTDDELKHLGTLRELRWLQVSGPEVTDPGLMYLKNLTQLEDLDLAPNGFFRNWH